MRLEKERVLTEGEIEQLNEPTFRATSPDHTLATPGQRSAHEDPDVV